MKQDSKEQNVSYIEEQDYEYFAFISYKREDAEWAIWLQRKLENYHLPSKIIKEHPELPKKVQETSHIRPRMFRDITELGGGMLPQEIEQALDNSEYLIVICSQKSAGSAWVDKEVEGFVKKGKVDKIIPFIVDGEPYDPKKECYTKTLQSLKGEKNEPIGIKINDLGREAAVIKVVATMLKLKFDTLWQRLTRDKAKRQGIIATIGIVAFFFLTGFLIWLYYNNRELESRNWKIKENQARYIAGRAYQLIDEGDEYTARFILSKVLPTNLDNPNYPYTAEAESALRKAWSSRSSILNGHTSMLWASEFSPDGKSIVTSSSDKTVRVWNAASGEQLLILKGHQDAVRFASFSPDSKEIASLSWDNVVKIWDSSTGELKNTFIGDQNTTCSLSYSPDGGKIAIGNGGGYIIVRDAKSGHIMSSFKGHMNHVWSVCYSHDGKQLVSSSSDGSVKIWNTETGKEEKTINNKTSRIWHVSYSPDDSRIIYVADSVFKVLDARTSIVLKVYKGHAGLVTNAKFSHDGKRIVSSSDDKTVKIWDAQTGELIKTLNGHKDATWDASFSPDDKMIVSCSNDNSARVWDLTINEPSYLIRLNKEPIKIFTDDEDKFLDYDQVEFAMFTPNENNVVFTTEESGIKTYNLKTGNLQIADSANFYKYLEQEMFSSDGKYLVRSFGNKIKILNVQNHKVEKELTSEIYSSKVYFTNNGKNVIVLTNNRYELWDWYKGRCLKRSSFDSTYYTVASSPHGYIATSRKDTLSLWNAQTGKKEKTFVNVQHGIEKIAFSPSGKYLACTSNNVVTATIWDVGKGTKTQTIYGYSTYINSLTFNPQENVLITAARDGGVKIWEIKSGVLLSEYEGDAGDACYVAFSPSGKKFVVAYGHETIKIWDYPLLQNLIDRTNSLFRNRKLTEEEKDIFHLE